MGLMTLNHLHAGGPVTTVIAVCAPACALCETHIQVVPAKCVFIARRWECLFPFAITIRSVLCGPLEWYSQYCNLHST